MLNLNSAQPREETPHTPNTTTATISNALKRRAQAIINDKTIDPHTRAIIRYGLEINDPDLPELIRCADNGESILESAREAGLPAPFACKAGVCATCRAKVTKGKVEMAVHYGLTQEEVDAGYVLTCQSVPVGEGVAVDYDA